MTIGIIIIIISTLGYISNWLNWRFLNYKINYLLYYFGAFIHESSHALMCLLTGARISEYKVIVDQPRVSYSSSKLPILGNLLIAIAPIFGGLIVLFFVREYFFINIYHMPEFSNWKLLLTDSLNFLKQINILNWKNLVTIFLFLNIGAMIGPSWQDLKNVWFLIIILIFIPWPFFTHLGLLAISLILINIIFQIVLIIIISILKFLHKLFIK
ncbi:MAG: M50 family metallopeptidase [Minisyncoccia bacterium]